MDMMKLNNGQQIPAQGFGVFMVENNGPCEEAVSKALRAGYRLIDTAAAYFNETDVGKAIQNSGISREEIFVTSKLIPQMEILPAVNQMECNPFFQQKELRKYLDRYGIRLEAWYPLGHADKTLLSDERLAKIAGKYGKSVVQVILRWHMQEGIVAIPKATSMEHIQANLDIFDFALTDYEMAEIRKMDKGVGTHDPEDMSNAERLSALKVHD